LIVCRRIKEYRSEDITECVYIFNVNLDKSNSSVVDEKKADPERERRGKPAVKMTLLVMKGDNGDGDDRIHVHKGLVRVSL
jgi:hypothetical protein